MAQPIQTQGRSNRGFTAATDEQQDMPALPAGGKIKGPGTGTSDSIPQRMRPGTFIVPADSVKILGIDTLNKMANMQAPQGNFTQEQAHAAGVAFLTQLRDATHRPVSGTADAVDGDADTEGPTDVDDSGTRNFANGGAVGPTERMHLNSNGTVQDGSGRMLPGHSVPISGAPSNATPSIPDTGRSFGFTNPDYWNQIGNQEAENDKRGFGSRLSSSAAMPSMAGGRVGLANGGEVKPQEWMLKNSTGNAGSGNALMLGQSQNAKGFEPGRFADGGEIKHGARGFSPKSQRLDDGGPVIDLYNIYPQGHPDAGRGIYDGPGMELGSSGKFAQVPQGVIGQQPPKPTAPPAVSARGFPTGSAPTKDAQAPGLSYADNNQSVGQGIKDSWNKGNYGEAVGKTVAGTVGMFTTPLIDGAVRGGGAAWDGAKGFGRGIFGMNDAAPASAAPPAKSNPSKATDQPAPKPSNSAVAAQSEAQAWGQQAQTTDNLKQRLAEKGREGMTNAEVAQANPGGVVTMKRQANGVMEFSGNNIKGPVSYADEQGQAIAGAGMRSKGFGRVDVAPAGANVVMGPNGSYAFSNDAPPPSHGQQQAGLGFSGAQGRTDNSSWMQPGMTAEQSLQYNQEVANARAINAQQQALRPARPEGTRMVGLMERTPDQQLHDAETQASSIHGGTAALGKSRLAEIIAANTARAKAASDKYVSDNQLAGTIGSATISDRGATTRAAATNAIQQGELTMKQEDQGFKSRLAAQQEQLRNAYQNATNPKEQAAIAERLRVLTGKDKPEAWKAIAASGGKDENGNPQPGNVYLWNPNTGENRQMGGQQGGTQGVARPASKAEFDALPKGAKFIDPNGQVRIK